MQLTGWTKAEAVGRPIQEVFQIVQEGTNTPVEIPIEKVFKTGRIVGLANHTDLLAKDGSRIPIDDSAAPITDSAGNVAGAVLVFREITMRRKAELALKRSERRSREILESITDAFVLLDADWRLLYINPAGEKITRRSAASLIQKNYWEEFPHAVGTPHEASYRRAIDEGVQVHL